MFESVQDFSFFFEQLEVVYSENVVASRKRHLKALYKTIDAAYRLQPAVRLSRRIRRLGFRT